MSYLRFW